MKDPRSTPGEVVAPILLLVLILWGIWLYSHQQINDAYYENRADFMASCMEEGKTEQECMNLWNNK